MYPQYNIKKKKKKFSLSLKLKTTRCLTPVILATQKQKSGGLWFKASSSKQFTRPYLKKNPSQKRASGVAQGVCPEFKKNFKLKLIKRA
jgi:hypothetical protein